MHTDSFIVVYFRTRGKSKKLTMDFGQLVSVDIVLPFPTLREACIKRIIEDMEKIVEGLEFNELASPKYSFILGPFSYLGNNAQPVRVLTPITSSVLLGEPQLYN